MRSGWGVVGGGDVQLRDLFKRVVSKAALKFISWRGSRDDRVEICQVSRLKSSDEL